VQPVTSEHASRWRKALSDEFAPHLAPAGEMPSGSSPRQPGELVESRRRKAEDADELPKEQTREASQRCTLPQSRKRVSNRPRASAM